MDIDENKIEQRLTTKIPCSLEISIGNDQIERLTFDQDLITIGRDNSCDIVINNLGASRSHAQIERYASFYVLRDLQSKTGTFIGGNKITGGYNLNNEDKIFLAKHTLLFKLDEYFDKESKPKVNTDKDLMKQTLAINYEDMASKNNLATHGYLHIADENKTIPLQKNATFFGKSEQCDVSISGMLISERHIVIIREEKGYFIHHLGAFKPPQINKKLVDFSPLKHGDMVQIGDLHFQFRIQK